MTRTKAVLALAAFIASCAPQLARAAITSGTINNWRESGPVLQIGDGIHHVSIFWSINQNRIITVYSASTAFRPVPLRRTTMTDSTALGGFSPTAAAIFPFL